MSNSRRRHLAPNIDSYGYVNVIENDNEEIIGISLIDIHGNEWKIYTQQGTIADENKLNEWTETLQNLSQPILTEDDDDNKRRLCLPEMVFSDAYIKIVKTTMNTRSNNNNNNNTSCCDDDNNNNNNNKSDNNSNDTDTTIEYEINAYDALYEWAEAHQKLDIVSVETETATVAAIDDDDDTHKENRGVSVLKSIDAKQWLEKKRTQPPPPTIPTSATKTTIPTISPQSNNSHNNNNNNNKKMRSFFHYDWTFSTPYAGWKKVLLCNSANNNNNANNNNKNDENDDDDTTTKTKTIATQKNNTYCNCNWISNIESNMPMDILKNTSIPIILYDQIVLYEDDLHDNGQVSLTCKIRVMTNICIYIMIRLWVRIDGVLLRVRETRICFNLSPSSSSSLNDSNNNNDNICCCRDVTWRECKWENLYKYNLPTDIHSWRCDGVDESIEFNTLLSRIPIINPNVVYNKTNINQHCILQLQQQGEEQQE